MSDAYRAKSKNPLLKKDEIGRSKSSVYDLPPHEHCYGRSEPADLEGAREVTMHWAAHVPRPKPGEKVQDWRKINKVAARNSITNAKDLGNFRKDNDFTLVPQPSIAPNPKVIPSDVIPTFAYGRKSRPSTPIGSVLSHLYCEEYLEALENTYQQYEEEQLHRSSNKHRVRLTRSAVNRISDGKARRAVDPDAREDLYKMSKFRRVPSKLQLEPIRSRSTPQLSSCSVLTPCSSSPCSVNS